MSDPVGTTAEFGDVVRQLAELHEELSGYVERAEGGVEFIRRCRTMNRAYERWQEDQEDIARGVNFANSAAQLLEGIGDVLPEFDGLDLLRQQLAMLAALMRAFTAHLSREIGRVEEAVRHEGLVTFGGASCSSGMIDQGGVDLIRQLNLSDAKKRRLFRQACYDGLPNAIRTQLGNLNFRTNGSY